MPTNAVLEERLRNERLLRQNCERRNDDLHQVIKAVRAENELLRIELINCRAKLEGAPAKADAFLPPGNPGQSPGRRTGEMSCAAWSLHNSMVEARGLK